MNDEFVCQLCGSDTDSVCRICGFALCVGCVIHDGDGEIVCIAEDA